MKALRSPTWAILEFLLRTDLGFHGFDSGYGPHSLHAFAAKFPPQLPRFFIEAVTDKDQVVLDPMAGSGTAAVEALATERKAIAIDIDPLAVLITKVKCSHLPSSTAREGIERVVAKAEALVWNGLYALDEAIHQRFDPQTLEFVDYWFAPEVQAKLMALLQSIEGEEVGKLRDFLTVVFSSIIITKSGGVSLARDLAHTRPHRGLAKTFRDPIAEFGKRGLKASKVFSYWDNDPACRALVCQGDARSLPLRKESVHLITTSPPYANAIDYVRAHKFSLIWLGYPIASLSAHRGKYIGSERAPSEKRALPVAVQRVAKLVADCDPRKALILTSYFYDMKLSITEMKRVLKPGGVAVIVVGPSLMRSVPVNTHECITEIMASVGFEVVSVAERALDRDKRLMPVSNNLSSLNGIEKRIHREFVIAAIRK